MEFMSAEDLAEYTGLTQFAAQKRFLRKKGIPFDENACQRPIVLKEVVVSRLSPSKKQRSTMHQSPNFSSLMD